MSKALDRGNSKNLSGSWKVRQHPPWKNGGFLEGTFIWWKVLGMTGNDCKNHTISYECPNPTDAHKQEDLSELSKIVFWSLVKVVDSIVFPFNKGVNPCKSQVLESRPVRCMQNLLGTVQNLIFTYTLLAKQSIRSMLQNGPGIFEGFAKCQIPHDFLPGLGTVSLPCSHCIWEKCVSCIRRWCPDTNS